MLGVVWDFPADWYADIRGPFLVDFSYLEPQCSVFTDCLLLSLDSRAHLFLQTERRTSSRAGIAPGRGADRGRGENEPSAGRRTAHGG